MSIIAILVAAHSAHMHKFEIDPRNIERRGIHEYYRLSPTQNIRAKSRKCTHMNAQTKMWPINIPEPRYLFHYRFLQQFKKPAAIK